MSNIASSVTSYKANDPQWTPSIVSGLDTLKQNIDYTNLLSLVGQDFSKVLSTTNKQKNELQIAINQSNAICKEIDGLSKTILSTNGLAALKQQDHFQKNDGISETGFLYLAGSLLPDGRKVQEGTVELRTVTVERHALLVYRVNGNLVKATIWDRIKNLFSQQIKMINSSEEFEKLSQAQLRPLWTKIKSDLENRISGKTVCYLCEKTTSFHEPFWFYSPESSSEELFFNFQTNTETTVGELNGFRPLKNCYCYHQGDRPWHITHVCISN